MTTVLNWEAAYAAGPSRCGGKGYNLARLQRYRFPIPDGGVLPVEAYRETILNPARLSRLRDGAPVALPKGVIDGLSSFLCEQGLEDVPLAVRSSATVEDGTSASFAGIFRSVLNVRGLAEIESAISHCYGSLWTKHARSYCAQMATDESNVECAIVICRMITRPDSHEPLCAGVAFSADPNSGRRDLIVIEAAPGLGENVVRGKVSPTRYVFRLSTLDIVPESLPAEGPLNERQSRELAHIANRIYWALGAGQDPQDIEWAHDGERFWPLQARPITHLPRAGGPELRKHPQYWSTANIKDAVPGVISQLSWSVANAAIQEVAFAAPRSAGYPLPQGVELVRRFAGRAYFDTTLLQWVMYDSFAFAPAEYARLLGGTFPLIDVDTRQSLRGKAGRRRLRFLIKAFRNLWKIEDRLKPIFEAYIDTERKAFDTPMGDLSRKELADLFAMHCERQVQIDQFVGLANGATSRWLPWLERILGRRYRDEGRVLCATLCAGSGSVTSAEQGFAVDVLADAARHDQSARTWFLSQPHSSAWRQLPEQSAFRNALERFLKEFGHRATYEADLMNPRWSEDPSPILDEVRHRLSQVGSARDVRAAALATRRNAENRIRRDARLLWPIIAQLAAGLRKAWAIRELGKAALCAGALTSRRIALEIGARLVSDGYLEEAKDVFHLSFADLIAWLSGYWDGKGANTLACDNRAQRDAWLREPTPPDTIPGQDGVASAIESVTLAHGDTWTGVAVSPGRTQATARIVLHPDQGDRLNPGEILIAPSTDPGWTPLFLRASAVVMEVGGYLSHGAIVAREYGLPAVANIPGLLSVVKDGEFLAVDGDRGTVSRVPSS